jgi:hypothetical protein
VDRRLDDRNCEAVRLRHLPLSDVLSEAIEAVSELRLLASTTGPGTLLGEAGVTASKRGVYELDALVDELERRRDDA